MTKRNDAVKAAIEAKRLDGLSRYAKNYQEKQGYFEEGMQLVYHYGGMDRKNPGEEKLAQGARYKRAHRGNDTDVSTRYALLSVQFISLLVLVMALFSFFFFIFLSFIRT